MHRYVLIYCLCELLYQTRLLVLLSRGQCHPAHGQVVCRDVAFILVFWKQECAIPGGRYSYKPRDGGNGSSRGGNTRPICPVRKDKASLHGARELSRTHSEAF